MATHLLYASAIPSLSTVLTDLDISTDTIDTTCDDIEKIIDYCSNATDTNDAVGGCNSVMNTDTRSIIRDIVAILDKLQFINGMFIGLDIVPTNNSDAVSGCNGVKNAHNIIKDIVVILDKLQCTDAVTMLLNLGIVPGPEPEPKPEPETKTKTKIKSNDARTATINYQLNYIQLQHTYVHTNLHNVIYNDTIMIYPKSCMRNIIRNGLRVTNMTISSNSAVTDFDIECCTSLTGLIIDSDTQITTLAPFAKTLRMLSIATNMCLIDDDALLLCTDLEELDVSGNDKITTCATFAKSLKILHANSCILNHRIGWETYCGITDDSLKLCTNIEILHATDNLRITTCTPFAKSLKILYADGEWCAITDDGLLSCTTLQQLYVSDNAGITTCAPFANTLTILYAKNDKGGIVDAGLSLCTMICELNASNNSKITTCAPFAKSLKILHAFERCGISDAGLSNCIAIEKLWVWDNPKITTCKPFARTLNMLDAHNNSGIDDKGLSHCASIIRLSAASNPKITTCDPFAGTLRELNAANMMGHDRYGNSRIYDICGIGDAGLKMCNNIRDLCVYNNPKITTCVPFARTLHVLQASADCGISNDGLQSCYSLKYVITNGNPKINKDYIESQNKNIWEDYDNIWEDNPW